MSVISRLARIARPYRGRLITGLVLVLITTFLETVVITCLFTALTFAVIGAQDATQDTPPDILARLPANFESISWVQALAAPINAWLQRLQEWTASGDHQLHVLLALSLITGGVLLLKCLLQAQQGYQMNKFANLVTRDLRQRLFDHLLKLSPTNFEKHSTGKHISRITNDVAVLQQSLGPQFAEILHVPLTITFALCTMVLLNWQLTLTALCLAPIIGLILSLASRKLRKLNIRIQERMGNLNGTLIERLSNVRVIQSFVREPYESRHVSEVIGTHYADTMRAVTLTSALAPATEFLAFIGMIIGVIVGGLAVINGGLLPDAFLLFLMLAQKAGNQFKRMSQVTQLRQQIEATGMRIFTLLDEQPTIENDKDAIALPVVHGEVTVDHVTFAYATGDVVLNDISFTAAPGDIIALVGPSGSGKTTLVNLLPRFYDPTSGRILVDGQDIRTVTLNSLREQVGIVPQETALFSGTIWDNIHYGRLEAVDAEVIDAARAANALEFIERLPEKFLTTVGERGARLSGGQRQRVAIARALLKNPRILILDEATSALDTESEHLVQQALDRLMEGRTTFVIAHRLSTVKHATRILVLENGRIAESGTHDELLARGGLYRRLYELQFRTGSLAPATAE